MASVLLDAYQLTLYILLNEKVEMQIKMKNQGNVLYLFGYLFYIWSQTDITKAYIWLIGLALAFFGVSLLTPLCQRWGKTQKSGKRLATFAESAGGFLTLLFALTFIPKARFVETHLALFGLLVLTFLATRNILPGLAEERNTTPDSGTDHPSAIGMPVNK